jgi:hypothetical protein
MGLKGISGWLDGRNGAEGPRREGAGQLPPDRLADRRGRPPGSRLPQSLRPAILTITAQGADRLRRLWRPASPSTRSASAGPDATKTTKSRAKELPNSSKAAPSRSCSLRKTVRPGSVWGASISGSGLGQPFCCDWRLSVLAAVSPHRPRNGRPSAVTVSFGSLTGSESAGRPENGKG